jgi:2'-5' RNA ligase
MTMRVFVAVDLAEPERRALTDAQARMQRAVRGSAPKWVDPTQLHITLKFLGQLDRVLARELIVLVTAVATETPPFATRLERVMTLGPPKKARVIVAAVADPEQRLTRLARQLDEAGGRWGVPSEQRPFVPHITIARVKRAHDPSPYVAEAALDGRDFWCRELVLYQSELRATGPVHTALCRAAFQPS